MRKLLPIILFFGFIYFFFFKGNVSAQTWVSDSEVTFVGKTGARSGEFLDWTLQNYDWVCVTKAADKCNNAQNPLIPFWVLVRNIVYALVALFVLATAFILVITRGQNITLMRFLPRFIFIIALITLSFSLIQFIYIAADIIQGFFLKPGGHIIGTQDLLYIGFDYKSFTGYRLQGSQYDESAFISLLLVRLTAITYYVMTGILLVRKIILWFFIIISPVFPLLLFYSPIRNTAKIWVGEFFRWLLYAPLFAIFLQGLVVLWRTKVPLAFDFSKVGSVVYPTAVNILLAGPGQAIFYRSPTDSNSVNLSDTFALYVVALLMLWVVILLPFLLLKIFLDYIGTLSFANSSVVKQVMSRNWGNLLNPSKGVPPPPPPGAPTLPQAAGMARSLPFLNKRQTTINNFTATPAAVRESSEVLHLTNLSIPRMRDVAKYESSLMSKDVNKNQEVSKFHNTLQKIADPNVVSVAGEKEKFTTVREKLVQQKAKGNPIAASILSASEATRKTSRAQVAGVPGSAPAITKLKDMNLPVVNKVQQVSIEDYEEVKKMWLENYQTIEPPKGLDGQQVEREAWIKDDVEKINQAISLLSSVEPNKVNEGMELVSNILPFLLIGGFSKTEVISYLKAKQEAARTTLGDMTKKDQEEDTFMSTTTSKTEKPKVMQMEEKKELTFGDESREPGMGEKKEGGAESGENTEPERLGESEFNFNDEKSQVNAVPGVSQNQNVNPGTHDLSKPEDKKEDKV